MIAFPVLHFCSQRKRLTVLVLTTGVGLLLAMSVTGSHPAHPRTTRCAGFRNALWLSHGWLGDDAWFQRSGKGSEIEHFRDPAAIEGLAVQLARHRIRDLFPHLAPTTVTGRIPLPDPIQARRFLTIMNAHGMRVLPWVGGVNGKQAFPRDLFWRNTFCRSVARLFKEQPGLAGIHLNIEPWPSGNGDLLRLLAEVRAVLPPGKVLSVAAYPPPTLFHPSADIHWDRQYYGQVATRTDQLAVMLYDTGLGFGWFYRRLVSSWTKEVLEWSGSTQILLGLPAYDDSGADYHDPTVENLTNGLAGVEHALEAWPEGPVNLQGLAIYSGWEMDKQEWQQLDNFLRR